MKQSTYRILYFFLEFISRYVNNKYMLRFKIAIGSSVLLMSSQSCCHAQNQKTKVPFKIVTTQQDTASQPEEEATCYVIVEDMPVFSKGNIQTYIKTQLRYPREALEKKIQGKVYVQFTICKDGHTSNIKIIHSEHPELNEEAIRIFREMPLWKPAKQRGKAIDHPCTIPVNFQLPSEESNHKEIIRYSREDYPSFPAGNVQRYVQRNLCYPEEALKYKIEGKVGIQFVIDTVGNVTQVKVVRPIDPVIDTEAIRVISTMPEWKPGKKGGKPTNTSYTINVNFTLPEDSTLPEKKN